MRSRVVFACVLLASGCGSQNEEGEPSSSSAPTSIGTGSTSTDEDGSSTADAGSGTTAPGTTGTEAPTTSTGPQGTSSSSGDPSEGEGSSSGGPVACVPVSDVETVCDDIDDDCNGLVDDVDVGDDGICDCLSIALFGNPGANASAQFQQWIEDRGSTVVRVDPAVVDETVLGPYDVVVLDRLTRTYTAEEAEAFDAWVQAGGGLMAMSGYTNDGLLVIGAPNSVLGPMGIEFQGSVLNGPITEFAPHPVTAGITSISFFGGYEVVATVPGQTDVIGSLPGGTPVMQVQERGEGKLLAFGDEWITFDSEWSTQPEITQLWVNIFGWLTPPAICVVPG